MKKKDFVKVFLKVIKLQLDSNLPEESTENRYIKLAWLSIEELDRHIKFAELLARKSEKDG